MFYHDKKLMFDVKVDGANAQFAQMLLEQFGGATGELSAALTYWTQSFHVEGKAIRDMLHDIAIEEFSHLEMVGRMIEQHTEKSAGAVKDAAYRSTLFAVRGMGPHLVDSQGKLGPRPMLNEDGNVVRCPRADIAAEAGARQTYEALIKLSPDAGSKKALTFLLAREIFAHANVYEGARIPRQADRPDVRQREAERVRRSLFQPLQGRPARRPRPVELGARVPLCRKTGTARADCRSKCTIPTTSTAARRAV